MPNLTAKAEKHHENLTLVNNLLWVAIDAFSDPSH